MANKVKKENDRFSIIKLILSIGLYIGMAALICIFFDGNGVFIYEAF